MKKLIMLVAGGIVATVPLPAQAVWFHLYPPLTPGFRSDAVMACHESTGHVVLFSGRDYLTFSLFQDCWTLQGTTWTPLPGPSPPGRTHSEMVYDSVRERLVLFGGRASNGLPLQDTWEWDGTVWSNPNPAVKPPARARFGMAFDRQRGVTVLFGGEASGSVVLGDLWEWDGTTWQQRTPPNMPVGRVGPMVAFDPVNQRVLLHGGTLSSTVPTVLLNDTLSWDGVVWQQHFPATPPPHRIDGEIATDWHRARILLHGGYLANEFAWEWDGAEWNPRFQASPSQRGGHTLAYDAPGRRIVLNAGAENGINPFDDTWSFATPLPATVDAYGTACAGSAGLPELRGAPGSLPWLGDTLRTVVDGLPPGGLGAIFVTSFAPPTSIPLGAIGMPGCELLVQLEFLEIRGAAGSVAQWQLDIPNDPALAGATFHQQAFPIDAAANAFGFAASNGLEILVGVR